MANIRTYNSLKGCFGMQSPFKSELPGFSIVKYSFFGNVNDIDEKIFECMRMIGLNSNSEFELFVSSGGYGSTEKIRNYYALWKALKKNYDISKFNIIHDCKINIAGKTRYVGVARFKTDGFCSALKIVSDYKANSFIYVKSSSRNYSEGELCDFVNKACMPLNEKSIYTTINYDYLYSKMNINEILINVGYDGEELAVFFIKRDNE